MRRLGAGETELLSAAALRLAVWLAVDLDCSAAVRRARAPAPGSLPSETIKGTAQCGAATSS